MNSKFIAATVIALSSLGATVAFADTFEAITLGTTSSVSRAQVMAEYAKARADGSLHVANNTGEFKAASAPTTRDRAEVRQEGVKALAARTNYSVSLSPSRM